MADLVSFNADNILSNIPLVEQHCHTDFTDGKDIVEDMVKAAVKKKLWRIIITEHVQKQSSWLNVFFDEINKVQKMYSGQIDVLYGFECKLLNYNGDIDIPKGIAKKYTLILGAVHAYPKEGEERFYEFDELTREDALELEMKSLKALVRNQFVNIIAHPLGVFEKNYGRAPKEAYETAIRVIKENNKIYDINPRYGSDLNLAIELCKKHGVRVNIGSDAHTTEDVGKIIEILEEIK